MFINTKDQFVASSVSGEDEWAKISAAKSCEYAFRPKKTDTLAPEKNIFSA